MNFEASLEREVLSRWNHCHGAHYQIHDALLRWNLEQQDFLAYRTGRAAGVPFMYAVASEAGVAAGIPNSTLWVSLWGELIPQKEAEFLGGCEDVAKRESKTRIVFGGEEFHFLPGIPQENATELSLIEACRRKGFATEEVVDFVGDLQSAPVSALVMESVSRAKTHGWALNEISDLPSQEALRSFLEAEFPGRWVREFQFWERSREKRALWLDLREGQKMIGFARVALRGRELPLMERWTPGAMKLPLRENEPKYAAQDSCLGPIGVARSERSRGAGGVLLGLALEKLRSIDAERVCIDWTNAYKYYAPLQFRVVRRYCSVWGKLP